MLPGNSISDAVDSHVAWILAEERRRLVVQYNMKIGELLGVACERAFVAPGSANHFGHWQRLIVKTSEELSDLSQQMALSITSAELVKQELKPCRREEMLNRWSETSNPLPFEGHGGGSSAAAPAAATTTSVRRSKRSRS